MYKCFLNPSRINAVTNSLRSPFQYPATLSEPFPNIQTEAPLAQLHAIPLGSIAGHQREEVSASQSAPPHDEAVDCHEVYHQSPIL